VASCARPSAPAARAASPAAATVPPTTGFLNRTVTVDGVDHAYQVYVPRAYVTTARWPIILALHGGGERGRDGLAEFSTDPSRVFLTGLSMGGNGAWYLANHHPNRFAAVVVVCGFTNERDSPSQPVVHYGPIVLASAGDRFAIIAERVRHLPIWIFHGSDDSVISVEESRRMAAALKALNANVTYTEFPGLNHNSWDAAYGLTAMTDWLFQQRVK